MHIYIYIYIYGPPKPVCVCAIYSIIHENMHVVTYIRDVDVHISVDIFLTYLYMVHIRYARMQARNNISDTSTHAENVVCVHVYKTCLHVMTSSSGMPFSILFSSLNVMTVITLLRLSKRLEVTSCSFSFT